MEKLQTFTTIYNSDELIELSIATSSKGNQRKWYNSKTNEFVKAAFEYQGKVWEDWKVEVLSSKLAKQAKFPVTILKQRHCKVRDYNTVYECVTSPDFSKRGYEFVSFQRILSILGERYPVNCVMDAQVTFIREVVEQFCGFDAEPYLLSMILFDVLLGNEDRHLNNFGVFKFGSKYSEACLFDFGLGLFEHDRKYERHHIFPEVLDWMNCKPFNANPYANLMWMQRNHSKFCKQCLPDLFAVRAEDFPNELGRQYFEWMCRELGVRVRYD